MDSPQYVLAIDNGTTSTRAIVFDHSGHKCGVGQVETTQIFPQAGWVEHDALEILENTKSVIVSAISNAGLNTKDILTVGITNQRETTVIWDRNTGIPVHNAIVWQDTRTQDLVDAVAQNPDGSLDYNKIASLTGLPLATYFAATKIIWILNHIEDGYERARRGDLAFGTIDTWLLWNLTGGVAGGVHATDVTNASRTLLMNITTLEWDDSLLALFNIPAELLPEIRSSSEIYGKFSDVLPGVTISGILGDQQAATFGQTAFGAGEVKITYGTGNFLISNTGKELVHSSNGLISTVAYKLGSDSANYALEGSIAVSGSLIQWLRDNLGIISSASDVEELALSVPNNGDVYFVPAFSGLFAPHWRPDARGAIVGLTRYATKAHIARAALEAVAFQTREVLEAAQADTGLRLTEVKVDGGMTGNEFLMQFQSDILNIPVIAPNVAETTALGAAFAAGLAVGFWKDTDELRNLWSERKRWLPQLPPQDRDVLIEQWDKAITKSLDWV